MDCSTTEFVGTPTDLVESPRGVQSIRNGSEALVKVLSRSNTTPEPALLTPISSRRFAFDASVTTRVMQRVIPEEPRRPILEVPEQSACEKTSPDRPSPRQESLENMEFETRSIEAAARQATARLVLINAELASAKAQAELRQVTRRNARHDRSGTSGSTSRHSSSPSRHSDQELSPRSATADRRHERSRRRSPDTEHLLTTILAQLSARETTQTEMLAARLTSQEERMVALVSALTSNNAERYVPGKVVSDAHILEFTGTAAPTDTIAEYFEKFEKTLSFGRVPSNQWSIELDNILAGDAQIYMRLLDPEDQLPFNDKVAALTARFAPSWEGPDFLRQLLGGTRKQGSSPKDAAAEGDMLVAQAARLHIPLTFELKWSGLHNRLTSSERKAYHLVINADKALNEAALAALTAQQHRSAKGGLRRSVTSSDNTARETLMEKRFNALKYWMEQQGHTADTASHRTAGVAAATAPAPARSGTTSPVDESQNAPDAGQSKGTTPREYDDESASQCRVRAMRASRIEASKGKGQKNGIPLPPPEYKGPNSTHHAANESEFAKRRGKQVCFACTMEHVNYEQNHFDCPQHGSKANDTQRFDKARRVVGAGGGRRQY